MFDGVIKENDGKIPKATATALENFLTKKGNWKQVYLFIYLSTRRHVAYFSLIINMALRCIFFINYQHGAALHIFH